MQLVDIQVDCDADTLLVTALPVGPACHRNTPTCFGEGALRPEEAVRFLGKLETVIAQRIADKMRKGKFDLEDLADQLLQVEKIDNGGEEPITIWNAKSMFDATRVLGAAVRRVYDQDGPSLKTAGVDFNNSGTYRCRASERRMDAYVGGVGSGNEAADR